MKKLFIIIAIIVIFVGVYGVYSLTTSSNTVFNINVTKVAVEDYDIYMQNTAEREHTVYLININKNVDENIRNLDVNCSLIMYRADTLNSYMYTRIEYTTAHTIHVDWFTSNDSLSFIVYKLPSEALVIDLYWDGGYQSFKL